MGERSDAATSCARRVKAGRMSSLSALGPSVPPWISGSVTATSALINAARRHDHTRLWLTLGQPNVADAITRRRRSRRVLSPAKQSLNAGARRGSRRRCALVRAAPGDCIRGFAMAPLPATAAIESSPFRSRGRRRPGGGSDRPPGRFRAWQPGQARRCSRAGGCDIDGRLDGWLS
jgi:hypothetical protein